MKFSDWSYGRVELGETGVMGEWGAASLCVTGVMEGWGWMVVLEEGLFDENLQLAARCPSKPRRG
jgi:hypothetical protein